MSEFRLTQISDTHLARRLQQLTDNFHRVGEHIDATRPDLVINSGDLSFDAPTSRDDLLICQGVARRAAGALPPSSRQSRHRRQPDGGRPRAKAAGDRAAPAELSRRDRRRPLALRRGRLVFHRVEFADHEHRDRERGRAVRLAGVRTCARRRQAGRAVPAQAALSEHPRRSRDWKHRRSATCRSPGAKI